MFMIGEGKKVAKSVLPHVRPANPDESDIGDGGRTNGSVGEFVVQRRIQERQKMKQNKDITRVQSDNPKRYSKTISARLSSFNTAPRQYPYNQRQLCLAIDGRTNNLVGCRRCSIQNINFNVDQSQRQLL
nr:unnamed protein product [Haemonchus contortus]